MAHATSEKISDKGTQIVHDGERSKYPETWWEKQCNPQITKRWLADTKSIINTIHGAASKDDIPPLGLLSWGTSFSSVQ